MILKYPNKPTEMWIDNLPELDDGNSFADQKLDGYRTFIIKDSQKRWHNQELVCVSRRGKDKGGPVKFDVSDEIMESIKALDLPDQTMLDAEWLSRRTKDDGIPECIYVFDILWFDDQWIGSEDCWDRRQQLLDIVKPNEHIRIPECVESGFSEFFEAQRKLPWTDGVIVKEKDSTIKTSVEECKKTALWIKVKWRRGHSGRDEV